MTKDLELKLVKRFPVLYQDYSSPMTQTCMCWGFDCGPGWFNIIWQLSLAIEDELGYSWFHKHWFLLKKDLAYWWNDFIYKLSPPLTSTVLTRRAQLGLKRFVWFPYTGFAVQQVKEKWGGLRFYCPGPERIDHLIDLAERAADHTCERCGEFGKLREGGYWKTLCDTHAIDRFEKENDLD